MSRNWRTKKSRFGPTGPAEEHVARRLHHPVAVHHALPVVGKGALARVRFQDGRARFLDLKEQRVPFASHEEQDEAVGPDAADSHHLDGGVPQLVPIQQRLVRGRQRRPVHVQRVPHRLMDLPGRHVLRMEDGRQLILDDGQLALVLDELREDVLGDALGALLLHALQPALAQGRVLDARHQLVAPQALVPQLQRLHLAELGHRLAVGADTGPCDILRDGVLQPVVTRRHHEARGEPFDVPLPRRRQRLVQVVDREQHLALGRREPAEVRQVRVSTALDADAAHGCRREITRHRERRAAIERERRAHHAPVTQRQQVGETPLLRGQDRLDGIAPVLRRLPGGVRVARTFVAERLTRRILLGPGPEVVGSRASVSLLLGGHCRLLSLLLHFDGHAGNAPPAVAGGAAGFCCARLQPARPATQSATPAVAATCGPDGVRRAG